MQQKYRLPVRKNGIKLLIQLLTLQNDYLQLMVIHQLQLMK